MLSYTSRIQPTIAERLHMTEDF